MIICDFYGYSHLWFFYGQWWLFVIICDSFFLLFVVICDYLWLFVIIMQLRGLLFINDCDYDGYSHYLWLFYGRWWLLMIICDYWLLLMIICDYLWLLIIICDYFVIYVNDYLWLLWLFYFNMLT